VISAFQFFSVSGFKISAFDFVISLPREVRSKLLHRGLAREVFPLLHWAAFMLSYLPWKLVSDKLSA